MLMNMLFGILPPIITLVLVSVVVYFGSCRIGKPSDVQKRKLRDALVTGCLIGSAIIVILAWNTYGYRVPANPLQSNVQQYQPQHQQVEPGEKLITVEDKKGVFKQKLQEQPQ